MSVAIRVRSPRKKPNFHPIIISNTATVSDDNNRAQIVVRIVVIVTAIVFTLFVIGLLLYGLKGTYDYYSINHLHLYLHY